MKFNGQKLADLRRARSWDQHRLANEARKRGFGLTQAQVSRHENGKQPSGRNAIAYSQVLGIPVEAFYEGEDNALRERREASGSEDAEGRPLTYDEYALYGQLTARIVAAKQRERV